MSGSTSSSTPLPKDDSTSSSSHDKDMLSLAARRARLRGTLPGASPPAVVESSPVDEAPAKSVPEIAAHDSADSEPPVELAAPKTGTQPSSNTAPATSSTSPVTLRTRPSFGISMSADFSRNNAAEMLKNIDQVMSTCAANLANLQKATAEQAEALKALTATLQDKNLHDAGIDMNSLTESFSSALEPMKEMSRLVPAIDQLNAAVNEHIIHKEDKAGPDELVTNLAQQLAAGAIDALTFKSAYKAVFPDQSSADLLRELVELLGTQRLSGDLFRAAYDAVQESEPAADTAYGTAEFEQQKNANRELRQTLTNREQELAKLLADKDQELQSMQEQMSARYEEFNSRYAEINNRLTAREQEFRAALEQKDTEITERESELGMLRRQMEELRAQTQEMVGDLQKQIVPKPAASTPAASTPAAPAPHTVLQAEPKPQRTPAPAAGFFDVADSSRPKSFYSDTAIPIAAAQGGREETKTDAASIAAAQQPQQKPAIAVSGPAPAAAVSPIATVSAPTPSAVNTTASSAAALTPAAARPMPGGAGRHGTGVRAQVFEVIVRQALAGAPWREMCAGPMQVNNITPEAVETEVKRRQANSK